MADIGFYNYARQVALHDFNRQGSQGHGFHQKSFENNSAYNGQKSYQSFMDHDSDNRLPSQASEVKIRSPGYAIQDKGVQVMEMAQTDLPRLSLTYSNQNQTDTSTDQPIEDLTNSQNAPLTSNQAPLFGDDGFTFKDMLDIINPLQNIPIINSFYRQLTGDEIDRGSRLAGGTLYGGPIGLGLAVMDESLKENTGAYAGEHLMANLGFYNDADDNPPSQEGTTMATLINEAEQSFLARNQATSNINSMNPEQARVALDISNQIRESQLVNVPINPDAPLSNDHDQNENVTEATAENNQNEYQYAVNLLSQLPPPRAIAPAADMPIHQSHISRRHGDEPLSQDSVLFLNEFANLISRQSQDGNEVLAGNPFRSQNFNQMPSPSELAFILPNENDPQKSSSTNTSPQSRVIQALNKYSEIQNMNRSFSSNSAG